MARQQPHTVPCRRRPTKPVAVPVKPLTAPVTESRAPVAVSVSPETVLPIVPRSPLEGAAVNAVSATALPAL